MQKIVNITDSLASPRLGGAGKTPSKPNEKTMKHLIKTACTLAIAGSAAAQTSVALIDEDFSASAVTSGSRFQSGDIDTGNWEVRSTDGPAWSISSSQLINPALVTDDDQGAHLLNTVSSTDTTLTQVSVSFDYTVGEGSTLFFHSHLFSGANTVSGNMARTTATGGATFAQDFVPDFPAGFNLKDGASISGAATASLVSFEGLTSGTFSQTYDISGFNGGGFSLAEVSAILAIFTIDSAATGDGAVTIANLNVTAEFGTPSLITSTWDGETDASWSTGTNWLVDTIPASLDRLIFTGTANTVTNNDLTAGIEFDGISFTNTADTESFSLGGNSITLGGDIFQSGATGSITDTISLDMELNGDREVNSGTDHNLEVSGVISEDASARGLTKSGAGSLMLTEANTYSGATIINAGSLQLGNGGTTGSLSTASAIITNGELRFNRSDALTQGAEFSAAAIDGSGSIRKLGAETLTLTAANTYTGRTNLGLLLPSTVGGTLNIQHDAAMGTGVLAFESDATFELGVSGLTVANSVAVNNRPSVDLRTVRLDLPGTATGTLTGQIDIRLAIESAFAVDVGTDDTLTMSGLITTVAGGGAGITKVGDGTLVISNINNSYLGNTTVSAGTLILGDGSLDTLLDDSSDVIVETGAVLDLNFTSTDIIRSLFVGGVQVDAGTYSMSDFPEITGAGSLEVTTGPPLTVPNIISIEVDGSGNVVLTLDGSEAGLTVQQSDDLSIDSFDDVASTPGPSSLTVDSADVDPNADGTDFYRVRN